MQVHSSLTEVNLTMAVSADDLTVDDLDAIYPKRQLEDTQQINRLKTMAVNLTNTVFGGAVRASAEIEGDDDDFALLVWAHYLAIREGETTTESQTGGSIAYARAQQGEFEGLNETRFGRQAISLLGDNISAGIYKADASW